MVEKLKEVKEGKRAEHRGRLSGVFGKLKWLDKESKLKYYAFMLFLASLSSSGASSRSMFKFIGEAESLVGWIAGVFKRIHILVDKWNYRQSKACSIMAESIKDKMLSGFLRRLSQALSIGVQMRDFINVEYSKYMVSYEQEYARSMDKLKTYSDAYVALLNSNTMILITALLMSVIFGSSDVLSTLTIAVMVILSTTVFMNLLMHVNTPPGKIVNNQEYRPERINRLESLVYPVLLASILLATTPVILLILGLGEPPQILRAPHISSLYPVPIFLISSGALSFIVGRLGRKIIESVKRIEHVYPVFIKTLGDSIVISGSLREGVRRILYNDYGPLNSLIKKLNSRLRMGVDQELSWRIFSAETGSELIWIHNLAFFLSLKRGARANELTRVVLDSTTSQLALREKRYQVAGYLKGSIIPLQGTFTAIFTLVIVLLKILGEFSRMVSSYVRFIGVPDMSIVELFVVVSVVALTIGNAMAIYILQGDSRLTLLYYFGTLSLISGVVYFVVSDFASTILGMFAGFGEGIGGLTTP